MEIVFLWVGLAFGWIGALVTKVALADTGGRRVGGEIIGYVARVDTDDGTRTFAPVIGFTHPLAGRRVLESAIATGNFPYAVGSNVTLLVDLQDASRARLETRAFLYFGLLFSAIGLGLCVLFFSIFDWTAFSVAVAVVVSLLLVREIQRRKGTAKLPDVASLVSSAIRGEAVDAQKFDRTRLLTSAEIQATQRSVTRASLIAGVVLLLLAVACAFWSIKWSTRRLAFMDRAVPAVGRVVDLEMSDDTETTMYAPVVEFAPRDAWPVRFRHPVASSHPSWRRGDEVRVLYDPADPSQAMIDQGAWNVVAPFLPAAAGVVLVLLGLLSLKHAFAAPEPPLSLSHRFG